MRLKGKTLLITAAGQTVRLGIQGPGEQRQRTVQA
jgi:hypothetical protein